jgi:unsaturated rhamnogalacturonyl hydrolase
VSMIATSNTRPMPIRLMGYVAAAALIACTLMSLPAQTGSPSVARVPAPAGDSPSDAGPLATNLSSQLTRRDLAKAMKLVGDWQLHRLPADAQYEWTFAALYVGMMAVPTEVAGDTYKQAMQRVGEQLRWQPGPRVLHADDQAVGQMYLEQYRLHKDPAMLAPIKSRMDEEMNTRDDPAKELWWWCDALFMAPPVLADLSVTTGDPKYLQFMDHEWDRTNKLLYDNQAHLFSRDATYLDKHEKNGAKVFWSRGNGWVVAGLVRVIDRMAANSPLRAKYVLQLQDMVAGLAPLQGTDGLWKPGLLDAADYPLSEISGSAFFTYAMAYGVNHGLLPRKTYEPIIQKAWAGMISHVYADGRLGCIQPVGAAPGPLAEATSYVYGVGGYLLAGSEIYSSAK